MRQLGCLAETLDTLITPFRRFSLGHSDERAIQGSDLLKPRWFASRQASHGEFVAWPSPWSLNMEGWYPRMHRLFH